MKHDVHILLAVASDSVTKGIIFREQQCKASLNLFAVALISSKSMENKVVTCHLCHYFSLHSVKIQHS